MNPGEIRIGNYINDEATTHVVAGIRNHLGKIYVQSYWIQDPAKKPMYSTYIEQISPIEITKKELLRFGYEFQASDIWVIPNSGIFILFDEELQASIAGDILIPIKYIHQLQNIVFDLYGKELTYI
jgi:hypothetical protein